jgi:hypothetical protein
MFFELVERYGDARMRKQLGELRTSFDRQIPPPVHSEIDEFAALGAADAKELAELFCSRYYFGCEGDDAMNAMAFHSEMLPFDATLKAFYGSDISHWDVRNMAASLEEAFEPVEDGALTREQFRDFMFTNPVLLHGGMNPHFFDGTRVEAQAKEVLESVKGKVISVGGHHAIATGS